MARQKKQPRRVALAVGYPSGFEDEIVQGTLDYAEHSANWVFAGDGHRPFLPFHQIDLAAVDGIIGLLSAPPWVEAVHRAGVCAVNTSTRLKDTGLPLVANDDVAIGELAARNMLALSLPNYGYASVSRSWFGQRRFEGFQQVVLHATHQPLHTLFNDDATNAQDLPHMLQRWLNTLPLPIGILAENDTLALNIIRTAHQIGLRVPRDLAVLGVDNDRWANALSPVRLSSIKLDARRIGLEAARLLDQIMAGRNPTAAAPTRWISPLQVVARASTDIVVQEEPTVARALQFMREHCADGITVEDVLDELRISRRNLEIKLKRAIGQTPQVAIQHAQIDHAKAMLLETTLNIEEISYRCGFARPERLSRVFKRITGMTPGEYRLQHRRPENKNPARI